MNANQWLEKALFSMLLAVVTWAATQLKELNSNVSDLNVKMAVIVERVQKHEAAILELKQDLKGIR